MTRHINVVEKILTKNDNLADANMSKLNEYGVFSINLMASPGAGKTTLIINTLNKLHGRIRMGVIEGDLASSIDAEKAAAAGIPAYQINTGGECHLDANMIASAFEHFSLKDIDLLIIENVGNLVCPVNFRLGCHLNVLIASIPEGDDKPYKYPGSYRGMDALIISKMDLLPYIQFDMDYFRKGVEILNPDLTTFQLSSKTGEGMDDWANWLVEKTINWRLQVQQQISEKVK